MSLKNGRPPYQPTPERRDQVKRMAAVGIPQVLIAEFLNIAPKTLRKHFRAQLDIASIEANHRVLSSLFELATTRHNAAAAIFWAKTRCGFRSGGPACS